MFILKYLDKNLEKNILILLLSLIAGLIFIQVFMRYVMQDSLTWSEELVRWIFVWFIWIGVSYGYKVDAHISVTVVTNLLPLKIKNGLKFIITLISLIFFVYLAYKGYQQAFSGFILHQKSQVLFFPLSDVKVTMPYLYLSMPVGAFLASFRLLQSLYFSLSQTKG